MNKDWLPSDSEIDQLTQQQTKDEQIEELQSKLDYLMSKDEDAQIRYEILQERKTSKKKLKPSTGFVKVHKLINQKAVRNQLFSTPEKSLLFDMLPFCNLESNMICDEDGVPMTQKDIIDLVGHDRRYVQETLGKLVDKGVIVKIPRGKSVFYKLNKEWYGA